MRSIKPLKKLAGKALAAHSRHRNRHRPTGCSFALSERVNYLDSARWDELVAGHSVFLSRQYLQVLEEAGPDNVRQRYALVFHGNQPLAAVVAQAVTASAARVPKSPGKLVAKSLEHVEEQILVCGNLLFWGFHGVAFHPAADRRLAWAGVAEALYRIRRADRLFGNTDLVMVKDVTDGQTEAEELVKFSYRSFETEPNMVLTLSASWKTYEDYLAGLKSDYRKAAIKVAKAIDNAGCRVELLTNVEAHAAALYSLYLSVHERQKMRLVTLSPDFIPALAASFNSDFRCSIVRRDDQLLGFVTTLRDGETAVGYYIGFEAGAIQRLPIYFRLLQTVVHDAIQLGCRRVSFGRTALEPKARLGARPEPFRVWIRHRVPALNLIIRNLIHAIHHDEAPDRNPFQSSSQS